MNDYDLESKEYKFYGFDITLTESIKIIKYLTTHTYCQYDFTTEDFSINYENLFYSIAIDESVNSFLEFFQNEVEFDYESVQHIILAIALHTSYKIEDIKNNFKELLIEIKRNTAESKYDELLEDYKELEVLLEEQGAKNIQFVYDYDCDCTLVRYEKLSNVKVGDEISEFEYGELKRQLILEKLEEIERDINLELDYVTKEYQAFETDEQLSSNEKLDVLYNTYKNIHDATISVMTRYGEERKVGSNSILEACIESIKNLENVILGGNSNRYKNELLLLMKKEGLNQISKNEKGQYYYVNLFKILVNYYDLLGAYKTNIAMLKWVDDGISAGYEEIENLSNYKQKWYEFYKIAKDKFKNNQLYSVYFSYLHNIKKLSFELLKKVFRTTKLQHKLVPIYCLPQLYI